MPTSTDLSLEVYQKLRIFGDISKHVVGKIMSLTHTSTLDAGNIIINDIMRILWNILGWFTYRTIDFSQFNGILIGDSLFKEITFVISHNVAYFLTSF